MYKLIRDNIQTIANNSLDCGIILSQKAYYKALKDKLLEEVNEFLESDSLEELVDIQTVLNYLIGNRYEEFNELYNKKLTEKGGFDNKIILFLEKDK